MVKIFIINLPTSTDRKKNISEQLSSMNLEYHLFPAVNGKTDNHPLLSHYDDGLSQKFRSKSLTQGQLGCYASHYLLWEKCVKLNEPIIVIEDDALIYPVPFLDFIQKASGLPQKYNCIRLFSNKRKTFNHDEEYKLSETSIHKFSKGHMSTTGYYLTPKAAQKFIEHSKSWYLAVDIFMDRFWVNGVDVYGTIPACLTNDPKFDSDIGYGAKQSRSLKCKLSRERFNLAELFRREYHNACYRIRMKRKP